MADKQDSTVADLTVEILRDIRDGVNQTNSRLDQTNSRLDQTNSRLDQTNDRLDDLRQEVIQGFALLEQRIDNLLLGEHKKHHDELNRRVTRLEQHLELGGG